MIPNVETYFNEGCGRCSKMATPLCRVRTWEKELQLLRSIILECGLVEELKWSHPCYTFQDKNIIMLGTTKAFCAISFFKGALLADNQQILVTQTENMQATRQLQFTSIDQIVSIEKSIKSYIFEAIEIEKSGIKIQYKTPDEMVIPEEFQQKLNEDEALRIAFEGLTPGRKKAYLLFFSQAKQSKTRLARVEKWIPTIKQGKGMEY
ncbi:YdeI family protein [Flavobacterium sp.]|uniref:YdeI/OmpD-associated family protein n=1 Tax=Flavobacterium sp. TaxID=239 RepID=UPI0035AF88CE